MQLREYQKEAVDCIYNDFFTLKNVLCVMATGAGKTEVMMFFLKKIFEKKKDFKVVIVLNKVELLNQTIRRFKSFFGDLVSISEFCGSNGIKERKGSIVIATIQSIKEIKIDGLHLAVFDEVHNMNAESGAYKVFLDNNHCKVLGFTATPFRASGGYIFGEGKFFERITYRKNLDELIDEGFLVPPRLKKPDHQVDTSKFKIVMGDFSQKEVESAVNNDELVECQVTDALERSKDRKKIIWACSSINHAESIYNKISEQEKASIIHSNLSKDEIDFNYYLFKETECRHLVFVTIVSEGFDFKPIDTIVFLRPTRSPVLYVQTCGRGLRLHDDKKDCLILDYAEVVKNCGALNNPKVRKKGERRKEETQRFCKQCREILVKNESACPVCGYEPEERKSRPLTIRPELEARILEKKGEPSYMDCASVLFFRHKSANGNVCLKISYRSSHGFLYDEVNEWFVIGHDFAERKMIKRLHELGVYDVDLDEVLKQKPTRIPNQIEYIIDGKFKKIKRLIFCPIYSE